jgi:hypothetical protein
MGQKAARTRGKLGLRLATGRVGRHFFAAALLPHQKGTSAACSSTGEADKNTKTGIIRWSPGCPNRKQ